MKKATFFLLILLASLSGLAQSDSASVPRTNTTLSKTSTPRLQGLPLLESFGIQSRTLGFTIDSAIMTRNYMEIFRTVEYLDSLEEVHKVRSPYISAKNLLDTATGLLLNQNQITLLKPEFQKAYQLALKFKMDEDVTSLLAKHGRPGEDYESDSAVIPNTPPVIKAKRSITNGTAPSPKSGSAPRSVGPVLKVVNNSTKNLYLYVEDEYKGIVYPGKEYQLRGLLGCYQIVAESIDQFRSSKKHCFNVPKVNDWVISN